MSKTVKVTLYDGGEVVGYHENAEIVELSYDGFLKFKVKETRKLADDSEVVVTREFKTSLGYKIEEIIEHSGLISV
jgi:hypothetical protein